MTDHVVDAGTGLTDFVGLDRPEHVARGRTSWAVRLGALRVLDIMFATLALLFLAPLMLLVALLVKASDGGTVFFRHERVGMSGASFLCMKFRSMVPDAEARLEALLAQSPDARAQWAADQKLRCDPRITAVGAFLRKSSLDELPQLFNVMAGDMSLVGPRPITFGEVPRYGWRFRSYCDVRPGITGLWQIGGRNDTTYRRRVAMDHRFARIQNMRTYLWVLAATLPAVISRRGSY